jgi:hypothetical protein
MALEFTPQGRLACVFLRGDRQEIIRLTYRTDGEYLITDQPSRPRPERTRAVFEGRDLILDFQGTKTRLTRDT